MKPAKATTKSPRVGQHITLVFDYDVHLPAGTICKVERVDMKGNVAVRHPVDSTTVWFTRDEVKL